MSENYSFVLKKMRYLASCRARIGWKGLSSSEYTDKGPYLIAGQHISSGIVNWDSCDHVSQWRYRESPEIALQAGDVILTKDGTIGRVARIDQLPGDATLNGTMMLVRPYGGIEYRFLYHYLQHREFQKLVADKTSGSSIPHLFQRDINTLSVPVPPIKEQRKIADILDTIDEKIRTEEENLLKLQNLSYGIAEDCFLRYLEDARSEISPFGGASPGEPLKNRAVVSGGKRLPAGHDYTRKNVGYKYLRVVDFFDLDHPDYSNLMPIGEETFRFLRRYEIFPGEVFFSIAGSIGHAGLVDGDLLGIDRLILTENAVRISFDDSVNSEFASIQLNSSIVQRQVRREVGVGGGVPKLALFRVENIRMIWPPLDEQNKVVERVRSIRVQIKEKKEELEKLREVRKGVMDDLLTGKVRVNVDELV